LNIRLTKWYTDRDTIYGFNQKTPQGKNQQAQTAQEAALESSQEAHLAEVILRAVQFIRSRAVAILQPSANGLYFRFWKIS
jgi:hypothetical protein